MDKLHQLADHRSRISRNIRIRALRLSRSGVAPGMEVEDIEQELRFDLIRRTKHYDPRRASFDTFADRVISNRCSSLANRAGANAIDRAQSWDAMDGVGGEGAGFGAADGFPGSLTGAGDLAVLHGPDLEVDVRKFLESLCPKSRMIATALGEMSIAEVAKTLGLHRSSVYDRVAKIRESATKVGLGEYLGLSPTIPRRSR